MRPVRHAIETGPKAYKAMWKRGISDGRGTFLKEMQRLESVAVGALAVFALGIAIYLAVWLAPWVQDFPWYVAVMLDALVP